MGSGTGPASWGPRVWLGDNPFQGRRRVPWGSFLASLLMVAHFQGEKDRRTVGKALGPD